MKELTELRAELYLHKSIEIAEYAVLVGGTLTGILIASYTSANGQGGLMGG